MKDYYQILGVRRTAGLPEIRRAYRTLAQKLHPDVNSDPAAHELIKEVNEAYDVLGDGVKKVEYDFRLDNPYTTQQEPVHRDPAYKRKRTYHPPTPQGTSQHELMTKLMPYLVWIARIGCSICLFLLVDFSIPHRIIQDTTLTYESRGYGRARSLYIITTAGRALKVSSEDAMFFLDQQSIEIEESVMLSELIEIRIPDKGVRITNLSTAYQNFKFVPALLLIFSALGAARKGSVEFRFNVGILNFFVLIFTIILLLK
jgi:curved DNA-binding protein CbpA